MAVPGTLFTGHTIEKLSSIDSTNTYALELLKQRPPAEGYTVWALGQFAGRGQRGNTWIAPPGTNLTFSVILHPAFLPLNSQFWLTKAMALSVASYIASVYPSDVAIKWPNDIYVADRKIAGILIENSVEQGALKYSVVGIGLNVNQTEFDPSLPNPTSLALLTGKHFDLEDCLHHLLISVEKFYLELRKADYKKIDAQYHELLYKRGVLCNLAINGKPCKGTIKGVNATGHLLVDTDNGSIENQALEVSEVKSLEFL